MVASSPIHSPFSFPLRSSSASWDCSWAWLALRQRFISCSSFSSWLSFATRLLSWAHLNMQTRRSWTSLHKQLKRKTTVYCNLSVIFVALLIEPMFFHQHNISQQSLWLVTTGKAKVELIMLMMWGSMSNINTLELKHLINVLFTPVLSLFWHAGKNLESPIKDILEQR